MAREIHWRIAAEHPSLAGHFPGNPIVPGVVLLQEIFQALTEVRGLCRLNGIPVVKFLAPLKPGDMFTICFRGVDDAVVEFYCTCHGRRFAQGKLDIG